RAHVAQFSVWELEEFLQQTELVHELESRRVDGVTAKIAQKILMLLQHHHLDAGAREQEAEHHAATPPAGDGTGGLDFFGYRRVHCRGVRGLLLILWKRHHS